LFTDTKKTLSDADKALAQRIGRVETDYRKADVATNTRIDETTKTLSDANKALVERTDHIESAFKKADAGLKGSVDSLTRVVSNNHKVLTERAGRLEASYQKADNDIKGSIRELSLTVASADESLSKRIADLSVEFSTEKTKTNALITDTTKSFTDADKALSEHVKRVESAYKSADTKVNAKIDSVSKTLTSANQSLAKKTSSLEAKAGELSAKTESQSKAIAKLDKQGSAAFQAIWEQKAQAGDIKAGIGLIAGSDGKSQVAVSASQFYVFDPNSKQPVTPVFAIDKGKVVLPKAMIEKATIQILNSQKIVADVVKAGISLSSPKIKSAVIEGGQAGFGSGGPYGGYHTRISKDGTIETSRLFMRSNQGPSRLEVNGERLKVFDSNQLVVVLGDLE